MWFERMTLEIWFDEYQYEIDYDIGESAVKYYTLKQLDLDLNTTELRYGHHYGRPDLRDIVAGFYPGLSGENIIVTSGASEALFSIATALLKSKDHAIIEHPNYPSLYTIPRGLGCDVSLHSLKYEDKYKPDLGLLEDQIRPDTKLIAFTHPNNPTGSMITVSELEGLIEICEKRDIFLVFDETYREMDLDNQLPAAATLSKKAISVSTLSKTYGLPGIRIGWAATQDKELLSRLLTAREHTTITNNSLGEELAVRILRDKERYLEMHRKHIQNNKSIVSQWIKDHPYVEWIYPEVGVVAFPRLKEGLSIDPEELYKRLVKKYKTFVIPGRCFEMDNRNFRLGFGSSTESLREGLVRLDAAIADLK